MHGCNVTNPTNVYTRKVWDNNIDYFIAAVEIYGIVVFVAMVSKYFVHLLYLVIEKFSWQFMLIAFRIAHSMFPI